MRQAANLHDLDVSMLRRGIRLNTSPTDFYPIKSVRLSQIEGKHGKRFGGSDFTRFGPNNRTAANGRT